MRVALLLDRFPVLTETFIRSTASGLLQAGVDVSLIARREGEEDAYSEAGTRDLLARTTYLDTTLPADALEPVAAPPLRPGRFDVLHAHFGSNARHYLFARREVGAPLVVTFHGRDFSGDPALHGRAMYDELFRVADLVTYGARAVRPALESLGCPDDKLRHAYAPTDVTSFRFRTRRLPERRPVRFLTVGRLVEKKGHEDALRAFASARDRLPAFQYDIVGNGPLAPRLTRLVRDLELEDVVTLHGAAPHARVRAFLDRAHVFVLASRTASSGDAESAPVALVEAQACGLPVVSTDHSGIPEVVLDGRSGHLVPAGDVGALAEAVVEIVRGHESWARLGAAGRAHVASAFDIGVCTRRLLELYGEARMRYVRGPSAARAP